ncbi:hypothetical protein PV325_003744 [Microctonus aethiopoides]|nr:hypothetical protein PV325_003744 [Microctonus aethiopoides]KAK0084212.1 hypothetical protein PV326_006365 [Microctonus aethiopoides]
MVCSNINPTKENNSLNLAGWDFSQCLYDLNNTPQKPFRKLFGKSPRGQQEQYFCLNANEDEVIAPAHIVYENPLVFLIFLCIPEIPFFLKPWDKVLSIPIRIAAYCHLGVPETFLHSTCLQFQEKYSASHYFSLL